MSLELLDRPKEEKEPTVESNRQDLSEYLSEAPSENFTDFLNFINQENGFYKKIKNVVGANEFYKIFSKCAKEYPIQTQISTKANIANDILENIKKIYQDKKNDDRAYQGIKTIIDYSLDKTRNYSADINSYDLFSIINELQKERIASPAIQKISLDAILLESKNDIENKINQLNEQAKIATEKKDDETLNKIHYDLKILENSEAKQKIIKEKTNIKLKKILERNNLIDEITKSKPLTNKNIIARITPEEINNLLNQKLTSVLLTYGLEDENNPYLKDKYDLINILVALGYTKNKS